VQGLETQPSVSDEESTSLSHVERLLQDCRSLLALDGDTLMESPLSPVEQDTDEPMAA
jgi:hypothetical protein